MLFLRGVGLGGSGLLSSASGARNGDEAALSKDARLPGLGAFTGAGAGAG